jgi:signal transduction histidine kinase
VTAAGLGQDALRGSTAAPTRAISNASGTAAARRDRAAILPRYLTGVLPALLVLGAETVRHELLHGDIPLMLGNFITATIALGISLVILVPLYRRLDASDERVRRLEIEQAVADERERIARELHDGISQALFFLNVEAGRLERSLSEARPSESALRTVRDIEQAVKDMAHRVRDAIFDLRTGREPDQPFGDWLKSYARHWSDVHNVAVTIKETGAPLALPVERELHVMGAIREALHNVARHAHATTVIITVTGGAAGAEVIVADDGRGLPDPVPGRAQGRYGLAALREQAEAAGGTIRAAPGPAGGTIIVLALPAPQGTAARS